MQQWNKIFQDKGKFFLRLQEDMAKIVRLFRKKGVRKVLDLGSGSGRHVIYLSKRGFDVYGIDVAKEGIRLNKIWLKKERLKAHLKVGNIYNKLPYTDKSFDAVISVQTINHARIEKIRRAIKEIERVLKPGGFIFITVAKKDRENKYVKYIEPRVYVPLFWGEKGLIHYKFNRQILKKEFKNFKKLEIWVEKGSGRYYRGHYCLSGKLKE